MDTHCIFLCQENGEADPLITHAGFGQMVHLYCWSDQESNVRFQVSVTWTCVACLKSRHHRTFLHLNKFCFY